MTETRQFSCGHEGEIPPYMGRGVVRQKRIGAYFARKCKGCALASIQALAHELRAILTADGKPIMNTQGKYATRPYTNEEVAAYVARRSALLRY